MLIQQMFRFVFASGLLLCGFSAHSESFVCTYPSYVNPDKPVLIEMEIEGARAIVNDYEYTVLQNTDIGIVLVRSFAEINSYFKLNDLGLFGMVLNKVTLELTRGSVLDSDKKTAPVSGSCLRQD